MADNITNLNADSFDSALSGAGDTPVLVDFWAPWCGPCKAIAPILEEIAGELGEKAKICKVDVDNNTELAAKFKVRAIPTLLVFKNGEVVDQVVGMTSKADLLSKLQAQA